MQGLRENLESGERHDEFLRVDFTDVVWTYICSVGSDFVLFYILEWSLKPDTLGGVLVVSEKQL